MLRLFSLVLAGTLLASCAGVSSAGEDKVTVFAAASLTEAFTEIGEAFEEEHEGVTVEFNFAGSQALATQIIEGGTADVFASANFEQIERVREEGLIDGEAQVFALNRLVVIVPADNPANISSIEDLASEGAKIVLAAEDVPVGRYSREALDKVASGPDAAADFRERVEANIVSNESNVRQVATKVQLGEADAGIVYATDVTADVADEVSVIDIPDEFNVVAEYPIAAVEDAGDDAREFIGFVLSGEGASILKKYGFTTPGKP